MTAPPPVPAPCATLTSLLSSCAAAAATASASAFSVGDAAAKARCLCFGSGGTYEPARWDDAEASCLALGPSSVDPAFWSAVSSDGPGWCTKHAGLTASETTATKTQKSTESSGSATATSLRPTSSTQNKDGKHVSLTMSVLWMSVIVVAWQVVAQ